MLAPTLLRTTTRRCTAALLTSASASAPPHFAAVRALSSSSRWQKDPGEGVGKKESIGGDDPVSARAKGVGKAAKSVAEGVAGAAEAAVPKEKRKHHAGPDSRDVQQQEKDKGKAEGLAKKGEEQGSL
ncbi:hypothetical protein JCM6882_008211 [Rhodosporidiobolus microsporus]